MMLVYNIGNETRWCHDVGVTPQKQTVGYFEIRVL